MFLWCQVQAFRTRFSAEQAEPAERKKMQDTFEELITQLVLKVDTIDALGNEDIRRRRREQVSLITMMQESINAL